jgi:uncharacterized protein YyaL (SSP411 family)
VYSPRRLVFAISQENTGLPGALAQRAPQESTVAYVCKGAHCEMPLQSLAELLAAVREN